MTEEGPEILTTTEHGPKPGTQVLSLADYKQAAN